MSDAPARYAQRGVGRFAKRPLPVFRRGRRGSLSPRSRPQARSSPWLRVWRLARRRISVAEGDVEVPVPRLGGDVEGEGAAVGERALGLDDQEWVLDGAEGVQDLDVE